MRRLAFVTVLLLTGCATIAPPASSAAPAASCYERGKADGPHEVGTGPAKPADCGITYWFGRWRAGAQASTSQEIPDNRWMK